MTTKLEKFIGIVLGALEAQLQGGGLIVIAHLLNVYKFIVLNILKGTSTAYMLNHHL
jgi:hypothetical protein